MKKRYEVRIKFDTSETKELYVDKLEEVMDIFTSNVSGCGPSILQDKTIVAVLVYESVNDIFWSF